MAYKIAGPAEPASYTFTLGAASDGAHLLAAYRNEDQGDVINAGPITATALTTTDIIIPAVSPTVAAKLAARCSAERCRSIPD